MEGLESTLYLRDWDYGPTYQETKLKPTSSNAEKLEKWEQVNAQALSMILMNIIPNVQAGLDCSSAKAAWDGTFK